MFRESFRSIMMMLGMNAESKALYKTFKQEFPTAGPEIFKRVVEARLKGTDVSDDYRNLSKPAAEDLHLIFLRISEDELRGWLFGLMMKEPKGIIRKAVED